MFAYVVIGGPSTRKSSIIRSLVGCHNRTTRDVLFSNGKKNKVYVRVSSLQETSTSAQEFITETTRSGCDVVLFPLWLQAKAPFPDAADYLNILSAAGWSLVKIAVLGPTSSPTSFPNQAFFPNSTCNPNNETARDIRLHFQWE